MYLIRKLSKILPTAAIHQQQIIRAKSNISFGKQSKILNRLIQGKRPAKKWHEHSSTTNQMPILPSATSLSNDSGQRKHISRRIVVLNKLFMQHISDMLANGEWSHQIAGLGLEISHLKITSDFHLINVYWTAKNVENSDNLETILQPIAIRIRHELSQLRLMGEVPRICFVKDRALTKLNDVDYILSKADFGDDYEPTNLSSFRANMIRNDFAASKTEAFELNFQLPPMCHDVLGLNQLEIMNKIKQKMTKNRQAWEKYELQQSALLSLNKTRNIGQKDVNSLQTDTTEDSKEILARFLMTKQYHRGKIHRERKRIDGTEFYQHQLDDYEDFDNDNDCDDFIDDEFDDK